MSQSRKIGVLITHTQKNPKDSLHLPNFQLGQIKIQGKTDACPLKKMVFPYQLYGKKKSISEFSVKNIVCPVTKTCCSV